RPQAGQDPRADGALCRPGRHSRRPCRALGLAALRYALGPIDRGCGAGRFRHNVHSAYRSQARAQRSRLAMTAHSDLTRNQSLVLDRLEKAEAPMSAYALLDQLRDEGLRAPLQVYRALDKLLDMGLAHRL